MRISREYVIVKNRLSGKNNEDIKKYMTIENYKDKFKNMKILKNIIYTAAAALIFAAAFALTGIGADEAHADQLTPTFSSTDGSDCANISDNSYSTTEYFNAGTEITISDEAGIDSLYILWEYYPSEWTLRVNGTDYTYGKDGYQHEFVELPSEAKGATSVTVVIGSERTTIADIYAFSSGDLPSFVQKWEASYEQADALFISTHADDEVLFFGGLIATLIDRGDVRVQVAYFTDLSLTEPIRTHEILNGLWAMGVTHYPQLGEFEDIYSESYDQAAQQYDKDSSLEYMVRTIRRFKPQVVVGQDFENGEYGHGGHMWSADMIAKALKITNDATQYPESAEKYGTWDVPKTYFHLYSEGQITLDLRQPLASFGGRTAYQVAADAYLEHQSQQWCWFYVSDGYLADGSVDTEHPEINCAKFGLYRSLVGADTGNDVMEHITLYDDQEKQAQAEALVAQAQEETSTAADSADPSNDANAATATETASADSVVDTNSSKTTVSGGKNTTALTIFIILAVIVAAMIIGLVISSFSRSKIRDMDRQINKGKTPKMPYQRSRSAYEPAPSRGTQMRNPQRDDRQSRAVQPGQPQVRPTGTGVRSGGDRSGYGSAQSRSSQVRGYDSRRSSDGYPSGNLQQGRGNYNTASGLRNSYGDRGTYGYRDGRTAGQRDNSYRGIRDAQSRGSYMPTDRSSYTSRTSNATYDRNRR